MLKQTLYTNNLDIFLYNTVCQYPTEVTQRMMLAVSGAISMLYFSDIDTRPTQCVAGLRADGRTLVISGNVV